MQAAYRSDEYLKRGIKYKQGLEAVHKVDARVICDDTIWLAHRLRHKVFAEELGWVPCDDKGIEQDAYDGYAEHFGVFRNTQLLSYLRLVTPTYRFMLEKEFSNLVSPGHVLRKTSDTREVSRLCVSFGERSTKIHTAIGPLGVSMFLYRCVYQWCIEFKVRYLYLVVEYKVFRLLKMLGFPCMLIGEPTKMPDGVMASAAIMDWRDFEERNFFKRPELMGWFNQYQARQDGLPPQRLVGGLQHQAFS
jgi:acyl homoserine lactone synthase